MNFNYLPILEYAKKLGLDLDSSVINEFDVKAKLNGLTQSQVEFVLKSHLDHFKKAFTPTLYNIKQRIFIALFFLTGYAKK